MYYTREYILSRQTYTTFLKDKVKRQIVKRCITLGSTNMYSTNCLWFFYFVGERLYYADDYCLALLLKGVCLKHKGSYFQAEQCFTEILT